MRMHKLFALVLSVCMLLTAFTPAISVSASTETEQTYGYDNIFDPDKDITVAYLGGSITEQGGYANTSFEYFTDLKAAQGKGATATKINAGIGGTPSDLGLYRLQHQILSKKPDVLFVEFAVNDRNRGSDAAKNMEGIVRMCMQAQHQPCVIFLISAQTDFDLIASMAARYKEVADYYNVGFIDFNAHMKALVTAGDAVWEPGAEGTLTDDGTHPNSTGHTVYGNFIADKLENDNENTLKKLTYRAENLHSYVYGEPKMVPHNDPAIKYTGDWLVSTPENINASSRVASKFINFPRFEEGYHEFQTYTGMTAPTIEYTFTGRSIGIFADRGDSGASATYVIDEGTENEKTGTIVNYYKHNVKEDVTSTSIGTQMTCSTKLVEDLEYGEHTIKITLSEPTNKEGYTQDLFAFGYFMIDDVKPSEIPTVTNITISGRQKAGQTLKATYKFKNVGDTSVDEGVSTYRWLRSSSKYTGYKAIDNATSLEYTTTTDDTKKYLMLEITPVNANGLVGAKIYSDPIIIRSSSEVSSVITMETAKLGDITLAEAADAAPVIDCADAIVSKFDISGLIDDFGYAVTMTAIAEDDSSNIIAYAQQTSNEDSGAFSFNMKPSKKILPNKTYVIKVGGKNVSAMRTYYFKTAAYEEDRNYTLEVSAIGGTIYNSTTSEDWNNKKTANYPMDTTFTLKATADEGFAFLYWKDLDNGKLISTDEEIEVNVGSGKNITAIFSEHAVGYTVTFRDLNEKIVAAQYNTADITAPDNTYIMGYTFKGWTNSSAKSLISAGDVIKASDIVSDTIYLAGYTVDTTLYTVTIKGAEQNSGSYKYNTKLTVSPAGEEGKEFAYWTKDGKPVSYDSNYSFYVNANSTIEAVYAESAPEKEIVLVMAAPTLVAENKISFFLERNIPEDYEVIESGILLGQESDLTINNYAYKAKSESTAKQGQFTVRKANVVSGATWYGVGYVIYKYGDIISIKYTSPVSYTVE